MDPVTALGVAGATVNLLDGGLNLSKALMKSIRAWRHAPDEILEMNNRVAFLNVALERVKDTCWDMQEGSQPNSSLETILLLEHQLGQAASSLEKLTGYAAQLSRGSKTIQRTRWIRLKSAVVEETRRIRDVQSNIDNVLVSYVACVAPVQLVRLETDADSPQWNRDQHSPQRPPGSGWGRKYHVRRLQSSDRGTPSERRAVGSKDSSVERGDSLPNRAGQKTDRATMATAGARARRDYRSIQPGEVFPRLSVPVPSWFWCSNTIPCAQSTRRSSWWPVGRLLRVRSSAKVRSDRLLAPRAVTSGGDVHLPQLAHPLYPVHVDVQDCHGRADFRACPQETSPEHDW